MTDQTPRTEAGRAMLGDPLYRHAIGHILAIEAEAAAEAAPLDAPTITVTRLQLVQLLDDHLPRMAFRQYGQTYNDDPDFDVIEYYERVVSEIFDVCALADTSREGEG